MDIKITKLDGTSYHLEDYKMIVKDVIVESIEMKDDYQDYEGMHGRHLVSSLYHSRKIHVPVFFVADDNLDYAIQRNLLYELVQDEKPFYIQELRRHDKVNYKFKNTLATDYQQVDDHGIPIFDDDNLQVNAKRYLVKLSNVLTPEQKNNIGNVSLEFVTTHLPFAESVETSLDLHKQLINGFWASDDDIDFDDTAKQTYIFNNVKAGQVYYHGTVPNKQFNMYKKVRIIIGKATNDFQWSLSGSDLMRVSGVEFKSGDVLEYDGLRITKNGRSVVNESNIALPVFLPGFNEFRFNQNVKKAEFDMRFYSK
ncbi:phage tail family protein [Staphylococcus pseudintermedius]|nr:phage tail family protein [Staphylococcus pseudintermedius]